MCYFLYCAMFEENAKIPVENLVWITEGLVKTIEDVEYDYLLETGNNYVKLLENCCLLHVNEDWIIVHDVLYDMEILIGDKDNCVFRAGQILIHFPHIEVPHDCKRISVRNNSIRSECLRELGCPKLVSLVLRDFEQLFSELCLFEGIGAKLDTIKIIASIIVAIDTA